MKNSSQKVNILEIPFDNLSQKEVFQQIQIWLQQNQQHHIATPNPEILLKTLKDPKYKKIIQSTSLNTPDGTGIIFAAKYLKTPLKERVTGTDIMTHLFDHITAPNSSPIKVFLLGAAPGIAEKVKALYEAKYPHIKVVGTHSGSPDPASASEIITQINKASPEILFVAFGAPSQELWINENLKKIPSVKIAIGVGGAFDFLAGKRKRAPKFLQKLGLEWLYRLIQQPSRLKRIINATIIFPIKFLTQNKKNPPNKPTH